MRHACRKEISTRPCQREAQKEIGRLCFLDNAAPWRCYRTIENFIGHKRGPHGLVRFFRVARIGELL
jgi:hypothetical protein